VNHERAQDRLSAYLDHDLGAAERAALDAHLAACPHCAADLEDLRDAVDLLRRLPDPEPPAFLATRVMARIAAGETRVPSWRRWLEPLGTPLVGATLAAAAAALAVFSFATPDAGTESRLARAESAPAPRVERGEVRLVPRMVGDRRPPAALVATPRPDPSAIARNLLGASHPHSVALAAHFDHPVRAVAYQPR